MKIDIKCKYSELVSPEALIPHKKNPNRHSPEQVERLAKLMKRHGFRHPILVSKNTGYIVAGHGRLMAAQKLGMKEVPVDYQSFESPDLEYAFVVSDNAIADWAMLDLSMINSNIGDLGPDFDIDLLGIKDFVLEPLTKLEPQCDENEVGSAPVEPKSKLGDIYELGPHRVMCGDSASIDAIDRLLEGESPQSIFTDPPYGIGIDGQKESTSKNPKHNRKAHEFRGWDEKRPDAGIFNYILALGVPTVIFGGNYFADLLPASRGWIYWGKGQDGALTMSDGEIAWTNLDKPLRAVNINRSALKGSVHPTQKPVEVIDFCFQYMGETQSVLDLFGGSGSTLIAAAKTNRKAYLMELDPKYVDVIVSRYVKYTGNAKIKRNGEEMDWTSL